MKIATENIEDAIIYFDKLDDKLEDIVRSNFKTLENLTGFIYSPNFSILTNQERSILEYIYLILIKSIKNAGYSLIDPNTKRIEEKEDNNWEIIQSTTNNDFRKRLDFFFDESEEEELLALFEDSLDTDTEEISIVGKEVMFIGWKTAMDCLLSPHSK